MKYGEQSFDSIYSTMPQAGIDLPRQSHATMKQALYLQATMN